MSSKKSEPPPLLVAMKEKNHQKAIELLNSEGLKKDNNWIDYICLIHAILARNVGVVDLLLKKGCRVKGKPKTKKLNTPLCYAVKAMKNNRSKVLKIIEMLLKAEASITDKDKNEETPLQLAVKDKREEAVTLMLLNYDVKSIDVQSRDEKIHFVIACINNCYTLVEEFINKGMSVNGIIDNSCFPNLEWPKQSTLLHIVVKFEARSVLKELLKTGSYDFTLQDENQQSPVHIAYYLNEKKKKEKHSWYRETSYMVDEILSVHTNILKNPTDDKGLSHFHIACVAGNVSLVKNFLKNGVDIKKLSQSNTDTFLNLAVKNENKELVEILIKYGADINEKGHNGLSPLCLAMTLKFYDVAETLLSLKADICIQDKKGNTPIHHAFFCLPDSSDLFEHSHDSSRDASKLLEQMMLIHQGKMCNLKNEDGFSIFHIACAKSTIDVVKNFIKNKADVNDSLKKRSKTDYINVNLSVGERCSRLSGSTALHFAAWAGNIDVIQLLLKHKADVNAVNKDGVTPVMIAIEQPPKKDQVTEMIRSKFGIELEYSEDVVIVDLICEEFNHLDIIKLFIEKNCNLNHVDKKGKPLLFRAFSKLLNHYPFKDYDRLVFYKDKNVENEHDKKRNERIKKISTSFFIDNFRKTVNLLIEHGADLNVRDREGNCIFHHLVEHVRRNRIASNLGNTLITTTEMLLIRGVNANVRNNEGKSPIIQAIHNRDMDLLKLFLKYNVDIDIADQQGRTLLHFVALYSCNDRGERTTSYDTVKLLLENGANINAKDKNGQTPIFKACKWENNGKLMKFLLDEGADIHAKDKNGRTALFAAAIHNNANCIQILLEYGVDISAKDKYNMSVFKKLFMYQTVTNIMDRKFSWVVTRLATHVRKLLLLGHLFCREDLLYCKRLKYAYGKRLYPDGLKDFFEDEEPVDLDMFEADVKLVGEMKKELEKMSATSVTKCTSLYDILFKSRQRMISYVGNEKLKEHLDGKAFPHFGYLLRLKFREASTRLGILGSAIESFEFLAKKSLPDLCLHCIFDYLTNEDLKNLSNVRK